MTNAKPEDSHIRQEVVDPKHSFVVSAPAGSGKTGLLTQRVLNLLSVVDKPEEILAITFTRKAAAEMHMRIFSCLEKAHRIQIQNTNTNQLSNYEKSLITSAKKALEKSNEKGWDLLSNPARLSISTIDGFSKSICNQLPFFSGVGSQTSVISNPNSEYKFVTQRWIFDELQNENNSDLNCLIEHFSGNVEKLIEMFSALLGVRDQWLPLVGVGTTEDSLRGYFESILQTWVADEINSIMPVLAYYEGDLFELFKFAHANREGAKDIELIEKLNEFERFPRGGANSPDFWRAFVSFCLTNDNQYRKSLNKNLGFPSSKQKTDAEECKQNKTRLLSIFRELSEAGLAAEQLAKLRLLPDIAYNNASWTVLNAMTACLPRLVAYLKLRFIELGAGDFIEFSLSAVAALDHDMGEVSLMQRLDYTIQHILIDEFQDTSQTQLDLLRALTKDWMPDDGKSLFLVGDGMQSCYGFRNANVGIFLRMKHQGLPNVNLQPRSLTVNFRSQKPIIDWVNTTFASTFPRSDNVNSGAVKYEPSISFHLSDQNSYVRCDGFQKGLFDEAEYVVSEIIELQRDKPGETIAILARSRPHLSEIISCLNLHDIDFQAVDLDPLISKQHIVDIDSIARFLFDQNDKLAYLALLRSPYCGLDNIDLFNLFNHNAEDILDAPLPLTKNAIAKNVLSEDGSERVTRFLDNLNLPLKALGRRSFVECVETAWFRLGGPETIDSSNQAVDVQTYLNVLAEYETSGGLKQWDTFVERLEKEYATSNPTTDNPVQVMTMHKSKGLEFDNVFLPSLEKRKRNEDESVLHWLEKLDENLERRFILSPIDARRSDSKNAITAYIKAQKAEKNDLEITRIFYVACTRAKKRLYLSAKFDISDDGNFKDPDKGSLIARIWESVEGELVYHRVNKPSGMKDNDNCSFNDNAAIKAFPNSWTPFPEDFIPLANQNVFDNADYDFIADWKDRRHASRAKGIVVHKVLQLIANIGITKFRSLKRSELDQFAQRQLQQEGVSKTDLSELTHQVSKQIDALKTDPVLDWIFNESHLDAESEWSLWSKIEGVPHENIIDRSFIESVDAQANATQQDLFAQHSSTPSSQHNSTRWIIDYKTTEPDSGIGIDEFLASQLEAHKAQLLRYRKLVAELDRRKKTSQHPSLIKVGLYFPAISTFQHYSELDLKL